MLLAADTLEAATAVVGALLVRDGDGGRRVGRIVEIEAYVGQEDLASHARVGRTRRNAVMFGPPGRAYVYLTYGMHHCLNIVTEDEPRPAALLVRAVEPLQGADEMRAARIALAERRLEGDALQHERRRIEAIPPHRLAAGPGLVTAAFGIDRAFDGLDMLDLRSPLRLELPGSEPSLGALLVGPRIGLGTTPEPWLGKPWRFAVASPAISVRPGALHRVPPADD